jgi:hypothetical protein
MNSEIYINISNSPAHKAVENKSQPILINTDLFPDLLEQALNVGITTKPVNSGVSFRKTPSCHGSSSGIS